VSQQQLERQVIQRAAESSMVPLYANPPTASNGAFVLGVKRLSTIGKDRPASRSVSKLVSGESHA
jgi:hypothetical protein